MNSSLAMTIREANTALLIKGDLDTTEKYFTPDYFVHITDKKMQGGHKIVKNIVGALRRCFTGLQVEVDILLEGDTRVAWQRTLSGTHSTAFKGFPASGLQIIWRDMVVSDFKDGRIHEEWVLTDLAERLLLSRKH